MKSYRNILLDVDGTLLDFGASEKLGIRKVLEAYGFEAKKEFMEEYHKINKAAWAAFERGEVTKQNLVNQRIEVFF